MNAFAVRDAGDGAVLLQCTAASIDPEINEHVIAIATAVRQQSLRGVRDVVPTFRSVAVHFDPCVANVAHIVATLENAVPVRSMTSRPGLRHEIRVAYGGDNGPDLEAVATATGLTATDVIKRHAGVPYRVFMLGFQPGFAYLGLTDPSIAIPRRDTPRVTLPAGAVGIAGRQTAVYPTASPGGWQIIGRALDPVFDPVRESARFAPGDTVTFVAAPASRGASTDTVLSPVSEVVPSGARRVMVMRPGLFTTVQDGGRWGRQHSGFPVSGAMDLASHALANRAVGNPTGAAALEITLAGPELLIEHPTRIAIAGADLSASLDGKPVPFGTSIDVGAGRTLRFGERRNGARAYVAFDGGLHQTSRWPVTPVTAGQVLHVNASAQLPPSPMPRRPLMPPGGVRLRVMRGPQDDQLPSGAFDALVRQRFTVSPESNRIGYRLTGTPIPSAAGEMISDATFAGGIQIPPSGQPILLMADRQTTGGYPQVATVISADLPVAGQLMPGDWVEFEQTTRATAVTALEMLVGDGR